MSLELPQHRKRFANRPAVIDWLQWQEVPPKEIDYPQITLNLIAEYNSELDALTSERNDIHLQLIEAKRTILDITKERNDLREKLIKALEGLLDARSFGFKTMVQMIDEVLSSVQEEK